MKKLIGYVPVDAGTICIVDPCYLISDSDGHHPLTREEWRKMIPDLCKGEHKHEFTFAHKAGTGLLISGFGGDGVYPVYEEVNERGLRTSITIKF